MKITYIEKGNEFDFKRIDRESTFYAVSYWKATGTSLIYFKLDEYNIKAIPENDVLSIEG